MQLINSLSFSQILHSALKAAQLLNQNKGRWIAVSLLLLLLVEACSLIPYLGFTLKAALAAVLSAELIVMMAMPAHQIQPSPKAFLRILEKKSSSILVLALSGICCFILGLALMAFFGNWQDLAFFFTPHRHAPAPNLTAWLGFKVGMGLSGLLCFFLPVNLHLQTCSAWEAISLSVRGMRQNKLLALCLGSLIGGIEVLNLTLVKFLGKPALVISALMALYILLWSAAMRLTSARQIFVGQIK